VGGGIFEKTGNLNTEEVKWGSNTWQLVIEKSAIFDRRRKRNF
jgi:hypothetical protein